MGSHGITDAEKAHEYQQLYIEATARAQQAEQRLADAQRQLAEARRANCCPAQLGDATAIHDAVYEPEAG